MVLVVFFLFSTFQRSSTGLLPFSYRTQISITFFFRSVGQKISLICHINSPLCPSLGKQEVASIGICSRDGHPDGLFTTADYHYSFTDRHICNYEERLQPTLVLSPCLWVVGDYPKSNGRELIKMQIIHFLMSQFYNH